VNVPPPLPPEKKRPRRPLEFLLLNISFPGVGSYLSQGILAGLGFLLTNVFAVWFGLLWYRSGEFPLTTLLRAEELPRSWLGPFFTGLVGVVLFLVAFAWAFVTSLVIMGRVDR
jgi:hypothetical protein